MYNQMRKFTVFLAGSFLIYTLSFSSGAKLVILLFRVFYVSPTTN
jgi:hypothetical protein